MISCHVRKLRLWRPESDGCNYADKKFLLDRMSGNPHCESGMTELEGREDRKAAFGRGLRTERERNGLSQRLLARYLSDQGFDVSGSNIGAWERGEYGPKDPRVVAAIDEVLGARGRLMDTYGVLEDEELARRRVRDLTAHLAESVEAERLARGLRNELVHGPTAVPSVASQIVDLAEQIEFLWTTIGTLVKALRAAGVDLPEEWFQEHASPPSTEASGASASLTSLTTRLIRQSAVAELPTAASNPDDKREPVDTSIKVPVGETPEEPGQP